MKARQEHCIKEGRGGKGSLYVWAGGNGGIFDDNMNYDGYANSRYTISVGAVNEGGGPAFYRYPPPPPPTASALAALCQLQPPVGNCVGWQ
jgi:hypothetical protein